MTNHNYRRIHELETLMRSYQHLGFAIASGLFFALLSAYIWAVITVTTEYQIGFMAIGVGLVVGFGVRYFGSGFDPIYGILSGVFALLGCLLGNLFSQIGFEAQMSSQSYFDVMKLLDIDTVMAVMKDSFDPMDLLFYGIAIYEAIRFGRRGIPPNVAPEDKLEPPLNYLRQPLIIGMVSIMAGLLIYVWQGTSGPSTYYYPDGGKMSEGHYSNMLEDGTWNYYYEDGSVSSTGEFDKGKHVGEWLNYYPNGVLSDVMNFENGMKEGINKSYYENGQLADSTLYEKDRKHGFSYTYHENGQLATMVNFELDRETGEGIFYHENGNIGSKGNFKNGLQVGVFEYFNFDGSPSEVLDYGSGDVSHYITKWDENGNKTIENGNGYFKSFYEDGTLESEGRLADSKRVGIWKTYHWNGKIHSVTTRKDEKEIVQNAWSPTGYQTVVEGNGIDTSYFDEENIADIGIYKNGLLEGENKIFYYGLDQVGQILNYKAGDLHGLSQSYSMDNTLTYEANFENGQVNGTCTWYYDFGGIQTQAEFIDGKKNGAQQFWNLLGVPIKIENYKDDKFVSVSLAE